MCGTHCGCSWLYSHSVEYIWQCDTSCSTDTLTVIALERSFNCSNITCTPTLGCLCICFITSRISIDFVMTNSMRDLRFTKCATRAFPQSIFPIFMFEQIAPREPRHLTWNNMIWYRNEAHFPITCYAVSINIVICGIACSFICDCTRTTKSALYIYPHATR